MILKIYKGNRPYIIFLLIITAILLWLHTFLNRPYTEFSFDSHLMPLYNIVVKGIQPHYTIAYYIAFLLIISQAFMLVQINTRFFILNERTYIPALVFLLLTSSYLPLQRFQPMLIGSLLLLFIIIKIFRSYKQSKTSFQFFDAAILVSMGSMFYFNFAFYMLAIWAGLILFRSFRWREWAFSIIGFILPYIFIFSYYYLVKDNSSLLWNNVLHQLQHSNSLPQLDKLQIAVFVIIGLTVLLASLHMLKGMSKRKIQSRKYFIFLWWIFFISVAIFLFLPYTSVELLFCAAIPLAYILSHYFLTSKTEYWGDLFLLGYFGLIGYMQYAS